MQIGLTEVTASLPTEIQPTMFWPASMLPKEPENVIMVKLNFHSNPRD